MGAKLNDLFNEQRAIIARMDAGEATDDDFDRIEIIALEIDQIRNHLDRIACGVREA